MSKHNSQAKNNLKEIRYQVDRLEHYLDGEVSAVLGNTSIEVPSRTVDGLEYTVSRARMYFCTCPDFLHRGGYQGTHQCVHIVTARTNNEI